jgi:two-component system cell cycle sensor histidine kinase/response regulator CckA
MSTLERSQTPATEQPGLGSTVLVAEDEALVRRVLEEMLKRLGFSVLSAANGVEALSTLDGRDGDIDLVVFDMAMPAMSGQELFTELRRRCPQAKTVLASGAGLDMEVSAMRAEGLSGYLPKPFSISQIREEISRVMGTTGQA